MDPWNFRRLGLLIVVLALPSIAGGHGSVTNEDDLCAIEIGYLRAHFKIYLAEQYGHDDFCEDLPATGESTFVMEYIHRGLGELPVEFRIIRNETGMGRFTQLQHVKAVADLDALTEFHLPAALHPDVFSIMVNFTEPGDYVGIVTVTDNANRRYEAVFPFEVGFTGFGYWPLIAVLLVALQLQYLLMSGRLRLPWQQRVESVPGVSAKRFGAGS